MDRVLFPLLVAAGLAAVGGLAWRSQTAPERLRQSAANGGFASTDLAIREMG
jgi:hypothetical protein